MPVDQGAGRHPWRRLRHGGLGCIPARQEHIGAGARRAWLRSIPARCRRQLHDEPRQRVGHGRRTPRRPVVRYASRLQHARHHQFRLHGRHGRGSAGRRRLARRLRRHTGLPAAGKGPPAIPRHSRYRTGGKQADRGRSDRIGRTRGAKGRPHGGTCKLRPDRRRIGCCLPAFRHGRARSGAGPGERIRCAGWAIAARRRSTCSAAP